MPPASASPWLSTLREPVRADAQHLPLAGGCCDRLMANHMLYHVPDQLAALGELRRIDSTMTEVRRRQGWNPDARAFHDSLRLAIGVAPSSEGRQPCQ